VGLLGAFLWRQRGLRMAAMRDHQHELEGRVSQRTRDLSQANVLLKAMKDSLPVGIRVMNEDGELTDLNAKVCEITGYSESELLHQRPPYAYWHPEEIEKHSKDLQGALEGHATAAGQEQRFRHKNGLDIHVLIYTAPLMYGGQRHGYVSSMVDITRQKHIEDKQRLQEEAMLSNAVLASMGELVFSLTHELGSPFLSISSAIEVAKRQLDNTDLVALRGSIQQIGQQSHRAREIMQRIRSRVPKPKNGFHACDVNSIVASVLSLLKSEFRRQKAKSQTLLHSGRPLVMADVVLLEQVLLNLVMNALQAMHQTPSKDRIVLVETGTQNNEVFIRVSDRGPGVAPDIAGQLFNLFYTTKPHGLGVGLNFCKTTVETYSGRLEFSNRAAGGAEFTVHLPFPQDL
jgi:two-component system sensor histidine kinase DctS